MVRHVRLGERTDKALALLAADDRRTIIGYIALVLEKHVEEAVKAGKVKLQGLEKPKGGRKQ